VKQPDGQPFYFSSVNSFSILERIDVGETPQATPAHPPQATPFSILERIDVGETYRALEVQ